MSQKLQIRQPVINHVEASLHGHIHSPYSYLFMFKCWHADPNERPTFSELVCLMSQTLGSLAGYLDVLTFGELEVNDGEESDSNTKVEEDEL